MPRLPARFAAVLLCFAPLFQQRSWRHAPVRLIGAILVPGQRTVTGILRRSGLCRERRLGNYHRILNRAAWSGRAAARVLLGLLRDAFVPAGPVLLGLDDTLGRRRGKRISAKRLYRDPVRSSHGHFVKASGLRWLGLMRLGPLSWAGRVWALPFLTPLAASERYCRERGLRHKTLTDRGRQLVLVADSGFSALEFRAALRRQEITCITRRRLDAALYQPAPPRQPGPVGRPRTKGARLPTLAEVLADKTTRWQRLGVPGWYGEGERVVEIWSDTAVWRHAGLPVVPIRWVLLRDPSQGFEPQALLCTDPAQEPRQVIRRFVQRWQLEVTYRAARDHLGMETQRQWSDKAIARTPPCLLGLFPVVTLLASRLDGRARAQVSASAWDHKHRPTCADRLAAVRRAICSKQGFILSRQSVEAAKLPPALREGIVYALCHAARMANVELWRPIVFPQGFRGPCGPWWGRV